MKKTLLTFVLLSSLLLSSCVVPFLNSTPRTPEALLERIGGKMGEATSYEMSIDMDMKLFVAGIAVEGAATGKTVEIGIGSDGYYSYDSMQMSIVSAEAGVNTETETLEVYSDGKLYISNKIGGLTQKLCQTMTVSEYLEYREDDESDTESDFDIEGATNMSFQRNQDQTWTVTCTGFPESALSYFKEGEVMDEDFFGATIKDVVFIVTCDRTYNFVSAKMDFVFDVAEDETNVPVWEVTVRLDKYNTAEPVAGAIVESAYTEVDDIQILDDMEEMLEDLQNDKDGKFRLDSKQTMTLLDETMTRVLETETVAEETDIVTYGETGGKYFYKVVSTANLQGNDLLMEFDYWNGIVTITEGGISRTAPQTEEEARSFVNDTLINAAEYEALDVTDIRKLGEGVYEFECNNFNTSLYKDYFARMDATYMSATKRITVTIEDGAIKNIDSVVTAKGHYAPLDAYITVKITNENDFDQ